MFRDILYAPLFGASTVKRNNRETTLTKCRSPVDKSLISPTGVCAAGKLRKCWSMSATNIIDECADNRYRDRRCPAGCQSSVEKSNAQRFLRGRASVRETEPLQLWLYGWYIACWKERVVLTSKFYGNAHYRVGLYGPARNEGVSGPLAEA